MQPVAVQTIIDPQLGNVVSESRVGGKRLITLVVLIAVLGALAVAVLVATLANGEVGWAASMFVVLLGLGFLLFALLGVRVILYTHGIERIGRFGTKRLPWDQLDSYSLNIVDPANAAAGGGGLLGALIIRAVTSNDIRPQSVSLRGKDGKKLMVPNHLKGYDALIDSLLPYLVDRLAATVHQELSRGVAVPFGKRLTLDPQQGVVFTGVFGGKQALPFAEVESTGLVRAAFAIYKYGQKKPWRSVAAASVPNLGVLQKIVAQASPPRQAGPASENFSWSR